MSELLIRPLASADYPLWEPLFHAYNEDDVVQKDTLQRIWQFLTDNTFSAHAFGIFDEDALGGFVHYMVYPCASSGRMTCYLQDLYVHDSFRKRGFAQKLIDAVADRGRRENWRCITWKTRPDNTIAQSIYDKITKRSDWLYYEMPLETTA